MPVPKYDQRAVNAYKKRNYKRIAFELRFEQYDALKEICDMLGMPVNTFIRECITERMQRIREEQQQIDAIGYSMTERSE